MRKEDVVRFIKNRVAKATGYELEIFLRVLWDRQTAIEQYSKETHNCNGRGFNKADAKYCSGIIHQLDSGLSLNIEQEIQLRHILPKYWEQYMEDLRTKNFLVPKGLTIDKKARSRKEGPILMVPHF